jgi:hypothetical protein
MIYYLVSKIQYNPFLSTYEKVLGFERKVDDPLLNSFIKPISIKPVENIGLTQHTCFYALMHLNQNRLLTFGEIPDALKILIPLNYTIDEILTKIEVKRTPDLVYVLRK